MDNDKIQKGVDVWRKMKQKRPASISLIRQGERYLTAGEDCETVLKVCGGLTSGRFLFLDTEKRGYVGVCWFSYMAFDFIIHMLIKFGKRIVICDNLGKRLETVERFGVKPERAINNH